MHRATRALIERLKPIFGQRGFKFSASSRAFKKKTEFGFQKMSFSSYSVLLDGGYQVLGPGLGVRHDRVQDIVNKLGHIFGENNRKNTTSIYRGLELYGFDKNRDGEIIIHFDQIDADVERACRSIQLMLDEDGWSFYDRYSSLLECSRGLNDPVESVGHPLFNNFAVRAYHGIACASFAEPHRVNELLTRYIDFATRNSIFDLGMYDIAEGESDSAGIAKRLQAVAEWSRISCG